MPVTHGYGLRRTVDQSSGKIYVCLHICIITHSHNNAFSIQTFTTIRYRCIQTVSLCIPAVVIQQLVASRCRLHIFYKREACQVVQPLCGYPYGYDAVSTIICRQHIGIERFQLSNYIR